MRFTWFFRRNRCCSCCRCCTVQTVPASAVYSVYSLQRFADVPMQIYYGSGYTEQNVLETIDRSLQTLADTVERPQDNYRRYDSSCTCRSC